MLQVRKTKKVFANFPRVFRRFPTKFQLFKKECCPRAEDRAVFEDLRLRGQSQGLDLRGQGQDFKMCPRGCARGQGRSQGLHLCYMLSESFYTPISGPVDRASTTDSVDSGSIPGRVKPKTLKLVFTASLLDVQQLKGQCEASAVCGRQVGRWQLDSKTERSLRCLLPKATW